MQTPADDPPPSENRWGFLRRPERPDEIGRLARYRILKQLGQGGMGVVFRAEDQDLRRPVALKVMLPDCAAQDQAKARFLREARAAAALKHDNVVTTVEVNAEIVAPLAKGDPVGTVTVSLDGETKLQAPVVALEPVESAGFFARLWDTILMFISSLFGA